MTHIRKVRKLGLLAAALIGLALATPAQAEFRQIDGTLWQQSSTEQKDAYLVGVVNTLAVYQEVQRRKGAVDEQAALTRYLRAADATTIEAIRLRLDRWYADNPSRRNTPVLGAIWIGLVERGR